MPQYETLSIKKLLEFAADYQAIEVYFPEPREIPQLPRSVSATIGVWLTLDFVLSV